MSLLFDCVNLLLLVLYLPRFIYRGLRNKKHFQVFPIRLGRFPQPTLQALSDAAGVIWLHAVSVGETRSIEKILQFLRDHFRNNKFVISTGTLTGNRIARDISTPQDTVIFLPLDLSFVVRKVVKAIKPSLFIIAETELWPNLIEELHTRKIPISVVNARLSDSSFRGYRMFYSLFKKTFESLDLVCAQTERDGRRFSALGAKKVKVTGNMKFDISVNDSCPVVAEDLKKRFNIKDDDQVVVAGSTHRGEDETIITVYKNLLEKFPRLKLVIAPRHIERTADIVRIAEKKGFRVSRYTQNNPSADNAIYILDAMGLLVPLYSLATVVIIGGSILPYGGHNPLEPAILRKTVFFGPHMDNFKETAELFLSRGAAITAADEDGFTNSISKLLKDKNLMDEIGKRAERVVNNNKGATQKNVCCIQELLRERCEEKRAGK